MYTKSQGLAVSSAGIICILAIVYSDVFISLTSFFPRPPPKFTPIEVNLMLNSLQYLVKPRVSHRDVNEVKPMKIAFCCSADLDVSVSATDLIKKLNTTTKKVQHHSHIHGFNELSESFSHYFSKGAAAEQSMASLNDFHEIVAIADLLPSVHHDVGGNAATMSQRAAIEGSEVLLGAAIGKKMRQHFHPSIQFAGHLEDHDHEDVHLVLEYAEGDQYNGIESPRANRYYLNHDIYNARLSALEEFEEALEKFKADLVVIGGLQLMEVDTNEDRRLQRLRDLSSFLQNLYLDKTPSHYEFAAASDFKLFDDTVNLVLPWVNSIGLNEQELHILHHYLITGEETITTSSRPTVAEVTEKINDIIQYITKKRTSSTSNDFPLSKLERLHFHTLQFHIICQKEESKWSDPKQALVHGALICSKLACGDKTKGNSTMEITLDHEKLHMLLPRHVLLNKQTQEKVEIDPHSPLIQWTEGNFQCHMTPMLACKKPDHTAGLGDNISGIGMAYHRQDNNKA